VSGVYFDIGALVKPGTYGRAVTGKGNASDERGHEPDTNPRRRGLQRSVLITAPSEGLNYRNIMPFSYLYIYEEVDGSEVGHSTGEKRVVSVEYAIDYCQRSYSIMI